jgi:hypothetical protein
MKKQPVNNFYGFIYKTILPDGRFYIGQHKIISQTTLDPTYFGSGVIIKDYIKSKGTEGLNRNILEFGKTFEEMNLLEKKYLTEEVLSDPLNINLDFGGKNNFSRYPEINARIGKTISQKRRENPDNWPVRTGKENNKSKIWKLISPSGEEFLITGGLKQFCLEKGISSNTMKKAAKEGWIPKRGICSGWKIFDLTDNKGTIRNTMNHGINHSGLNNPWHKNKKKRITKDVVSESESA